MDGNKQEGGNSNNYNEEEVVVVEEDDDDDEEEMQDVLKASGKINQDEFKNVLVETQPPFCQVCKQYLTEFSCNKIDATHCPFFEIESNKEKEKK